MSAKRFGLSLNLTLREVSLIAGLLMCIVFGLCGWAVWRGSAELAGAEAKVAAAVQVQTSTGVALETARRVSEQTNVFLLHPTRTGIAALGAAQADARSALDDLATSKDAAIMQKAGQNFDVVAGALARLIALQTDIGLAENYEAALDDSGTSFAALVQALDMAMAVPVGWWDPLH